MRRREGQSGAAMRAGGRPPLRRGSMCAGRGGFSLIEVVLATVIFVGAVAAVSHLVNLGLWAADMSRARAIGAMLAETKLAEFEADLSEASVEGSGESEEYPGFKWEVTRQTGGVSGIESVTVKITYETHDDSFELAVTRWLARETAGF